MTSQASGISSQHSEWREKTDVITQMYYFPGLIQQAIRLSSAFKFQQDWVGNVKRYRDSVKWVTNHSFVVLRVGFLTFGLERKHVISSCVKYGGRARKGGFETSDVLFFNPPWVMTDLNLLLENNTLLLVWCSTYTNWTTSILQKQLRYSCNVFYISKWNISNITTHFWALTYYDYFIFDVCKTWTKFSFCPCSQ